MRFGVCYSYWQRDWSLGHAEIEAAVSRIAGLGLSVLEIGTGDIAALSGQQRRQLRRLCEAAGVELVAGGGLSKAFDVASEDEDVRQGGIRRMRDFMPLLAEAGVHRVVGTLFGYWAYDYSVPFDKAVAWQHSVASMREIAEAAAGDGIEICLEVVNRYEHFLLNTAEEAVRYVEAVDRRNVGILLDSFHMNVEEDDLGDAIRTAGRHLMHFHVGETNRKLPGTGHIDWRSIGRALHDIGYRGAVVMEPFVLAQCQVAQDIYVWRDLSEGADERGLDAALVRSVGFLQHAFA